MIQEDQSGRGMRPKSRSFSSEANESRMRREKKFSTESNNHSPHNRRRQSDNFEAGRNLSPESKRFLKAMMTSGHPAKDPLPLREPLQVFGPALPPNLPVQSSSKRKMKSRRYSPSSRESSRSSSTSSSPSSSASASRFSSSSSRSEERVRSKERSSRRHEDRRKSFKNKEHRRSRSRDISSQRKRDSAKVSGSSNLKSETIKLEKNSATQKRLTFTDGNRKRNRQDEHSLDGSPSSKKRKLTPTLEKSRKQVQERNKDSECRDSHSSGKKKSVANAKRNSNAHEYSSKTALISYSTSSSSSPSRSDREQKSTEAKHKPDAKQNTKETSTDKAAAASGETLQDLEQFLLDLKAKKKALSK